MTEHKIIKQTEKTYRYLITKNAVKYL